MMKKEIVRRLTCPACRDELVLRHGMSLAVILVALTVLATASNWANAQTFTTLLSFDGTNGLYPEGDLTLSGSTLYGMTEVGGTNNNNNGNIFSISTNGTGFQHLLSFNGTNGQRPYGSLTLYGSTLYGMTGGGSTTSPGNIFSINTNGTGLQNLLSFDGISGQRPFWNNLTLSGSTLYGMTWGGGTSGLGNIFSINTDGTGFQNLLSFSGTNGNQPYGSLTLSGSSLFGMTAYGGTNGRGNIFKINTDGTGFQDLFSFDGTNGSAPFGNLTLDGSTLYGMTNEYNVNGNGNIFKLDTDGTGFQNLLSFSGTTGAYLGADPYGSLILCNSLLYGMTQQGGINGKGNIFSVSTDGTEFDNLVSFDGTNGRTPYGDVTLDGSTLYGMTQGGGANDDGTVFALNLNPTPEPSTVVLLTAGAIGLLGYKWRRRRAARRTAQPELDDDGPAILAFHSNAAHQPTLARRAT